MSRPELEDEASFFSLSTEFLEAAEMLYSTPPKKVCFSIVILYLLGHSAELPLKSFLYKRGISLEQLKRAYGHNFSKLAGRCYQIGLPHTVSTKYIVELSFAYTPKQLEYRQRQETQLPPIRDLVQEIRLLQQCVFNHAAEF